MAMQRIELAGSKLAKLREELPMHFRHQGGLADPRVSGQQDEQLSATRSALKSIAQSLLFGASAIKSGGNHQLSRHILQPELEVGELPCSAQLPQTFLEVGRNAVRALIAILGVLGQELA